MSVGDDAGDRLDHAQSRRLLDAARTAPPGVGEWVGAYELITEIGRGGHSAWVVRGGSGPRHGGGIERCSHGRAEACSPGFAPPPTVLDCCLGMR